MTAKNIDLTAQRFGSWLVIDRAPKTRHVNTQARWNCRCDCGTERIVASQPLRKGLSVSCGCTKGGKIAAARTKHGSCNTGTYSSWCAMRARCAGNSNSSLLYYMPHDIKVCERWNDFAAFLADMGPRPPGMSIDRFPDKNGDYEPGNCRWATGSEQALNRRTQRPRGACQEALIAITALRASRRMAA